MTDTPPFGAFAPTGAVRWLMERTRTLPDTWAARRLALALRRVAIKLLRGRPVDTEALGARMRLHPYNNVCEKKVLFTPQYFDAAERDVLADRIRAAGEGPGGQPGFTFIDIGANVGAYALFVAALAGPRARILAVEPQPDIFDRLVYNIGQNPSGAIKAIACAVADKTGELTLFLDPKNSGESSVRIVGASQLSTIRVPAITLLDLCRNEGLTRIDAAKLDVEGAEDIILEPFFRDAPPDLLPGLVILEDGSGRWQIDLPARMEAMGYRLLLRNRLNFVYERT